MTATSLLEAPPDTTSVAHWLYMQTRTQNEVHPACHKAFQRVTLPKRGLHGEQNTPRFHPALALLYASHLSSLDLSHLICETKSETYDL